jgi:membrane-bound serine protease (ClpP class)
MNYTFRMGFVLAMCVLAWGWQAGAADTSEPAALPEPREVEAAIIPCKGMIDQSLLYSIRRRTERALDAGARYLVYEISTYGGLVDAADDIAKYLIQEVAPRGHTAAYVATEAISAGAMISVSCQDIIMRENTTIGDAAPITMGGTLEGVEREKAESFVRATFQRAAEANGYPPLLLKAMVTMQTEVYRVQNGATGQYEFFEADNLPTDPNQYDVKGAQKIVAKDELLTLTAPKALEYGIARAVVKDRAGALAFLAQRDGVTFPGAPLVLETTWSEHMVSWLNSPTVMAILVMLALLGVYMELHTPGLGLAGLLAVVCFAIIVGSKYLVGMANWVEILVLAVGILLLLVEIFVLPGFGIAGFLGIACILLGLFGMLIRNPPDKLPWPETPTDWQSLSSGAISLAAGLGGFLALAWLLSRYLPEIPFMRGLVLSPGGSGGAATAVGGVVSRPSAGPVRVGARGEVVSKLRPAGKARFGELLVDVVAVGEFLDAGTRIEIVAIHGNRVVVQRVEQGDER